MSAPADPDAASEHELDLADVVDAAHLDGDQADCTADAGGAMTNPSDTQPTETGGPPAGNARTSTIDPPLAVPGAGGGGPPAARSVVNPSFVGPGAGGGGPPPAHSSVDPPFTGQGAVSRAEFQAVNTSIMEQRAEFQTANASIVEQLNALAVAVSNLSVQGQAAAPAEPPSATSSLTQDPPAVSPAAPEPAADGALPGRDKMLREFVQDLALEERPAFFKLVSGDRVDRTLVSEAGATFTELDERELHLNGTTWRNLVKVASTLSRFSKESAVVALVKRIAIAVSPGPEAIASIIRLINQQLNEMHATVTVNQFLRHDALKLVMPGDAGARRDGPGLDERASILSHGADLAGDTELDEHFQTLIETMPAELAKLYNGFGMRKGRSAVPEAAIHFFTRALKVEYSLVFVARTLAGLVGVKPELFHDQSTAKVVAGEISEIHQQPSA